MLILIFVDRSGWEAHRRQAEEMGDMKGRGGLDHWILWWALEPCENMNSCAGSTASTNGAPNAQLEQIWVDNLSLQAFAICSIFLFEKESLESFQLTSHLLASPASAVYHTLSKTSINSLWFVRIKSRRFDFSRPFNSILYPPNDWNQLRRCLAWIMADIVIARIRQPIVTLASNTTNQCWLMPVVTKVCIAP